MSRLASWRRALGSLEIPVTSISENIPSSLVTPLLGLFFWRFEAKTCHYHKLETVKVTYIHFFFCRPMDSLSVLGSEGVSRFTNKTLISDWIVWTWANVPIAFLFPFGGLTSSSGSSSSDEDRVPGVVDRLGNTWELERDCKISEASEGLISVLSAPASAACWALSSAAFRASAALWASAATLWDLRAGFDELLTSVTLAVATMERLGLDPDGSWSRLSIPVAPKSAKNYEILSDV